MTDEAGEPKASLVSNEGQGSPGQKPCDSKENSAAVPSLVPVNSVANTTAADPASALPSSSVEDAPAKPAPVASASTCTAESDQASHPEPSSDSAAPVPSGLTAVTSTSGAPEKALVPVPEGAAPPSNCGLVPLAQSQEPPPTSSLKRVADTKGQLPHGAGGVDPTTGDLKVFVGCLDENTTGEELKSWFEPFGNLSDVIVLRDPAGVSKRCAFVFFTSKDSADAAIRGIDGKYKDKNAQWPIAVRYAAAKKQESRAPPIRPVMPRPMLMPGAMPRGMPMGMPGVLPGVLPGGFPGVRAPLVRPHHAPSVLGPMPVPAMPLPGGAQPFVAPGYGVRPNMGYGAQPSAGYGGPPVTPPGVAPFGQGLAPRSQRPQPPHGVRYTPY
mmetsp:Transcript_58037/g.136782  ORF Transcript_58037/g.136782 Transcript_58037/m.136782 type:complete len:384 (-) Transcript_58037:192-1343(-)